MTAGLDGEGRLQALIAKWRARVTDAHQLAGRGSDDTHRGVLMDMANLLSKCADELQEALSVPAAPPPQADPLQGMLDAKYLNPACAADGCQWLKCDIPQLLATMEADMRENQPLHLWDGIKHAMRLIEEQK